MPAHVLGDRQQIAGQGEDSGRMQPARSLEERLAFTQPRRKARHDVYRHVRTTRQRGKISTHRFECGTTAHTTRGIGHDIAPFRQLPRCSHGGVCVEHDADNVLTLQRGQLRLVRAVLDRGQIIGGWVIRSATIEHHGPAAAVTSQRAEHCQRHLNAACEQRGSWRNGAMSWPIPLACAVVPHSNRCV